MFENITKIFKKMNKSGKKEVNNSKEAAKERLHLVLMQDRANVSADFLELMKQEIIEVIKKYIDVDENAIDVRLTNKDNGDGTNGAPALYANIPIKNIKNDAKKTIEKKEENKEKEE
ncbi:MAG: cell division topological specificity factor MinE, partial [Clostridia bacterium]|nr:cell division topological specificity factor MinE [Clostridia bacterium]